jgi:hypothetical protein
MLDRHVAAEQAHQAGGAQRSPDPNAQNSTTSLGL